ncbi:S41 family peptidase [Polaromonas sp. UC242_47]|uniref:S41 family peptidase n=1 Tax=Polaromonas sp. UC242_47 TaxID=3374626 RepID=UPI0037A75951
MTRFAWMVWTLSALSLQVFAQPTEPSNSPSRRASEIAAVMAVLTENALAIFSYPELFESCTQTSSPAKLLSGTKDINSVRLAVLEHISSLRLATDSDANTWFHQCIGRMMKTAGPRSRYYTLEELQRPGKTHAYGLGLILARLDEAWVVREAIAGLPAAVAGVETGDVLLSLDGVQLTGLSFAQLEDAVGDSKNMVVQLIWRSRRENRMETRIVQRTPSSIDSKVVVERMPDHVYMRIARFEKNTKWLFLEALRGSQIDPRVTKVLDLRGNPGGLLQTAHWLAAVMGQNEKRGRWLPVKYRTGSMFQDASLEDHLDRYEYAIRRVAEPSAAEIRAWSEAPRWFVLIDGQTTSGAAWLAGTLKELNGALLVGNTSDSGNASVYTIRPMGPGKDLAAIRYESGKLMLPSGKFLTVDSLSPDVPVGPGLDFIKPYPQSGAEWRRDPMYGEVQKKLKW